MKQFANILAAMTLGTLVSVAPFFALYPVPADATVYDATNNPTIFQNLPACTANRDMSKAAITDGPANPAFGQTVTGGGGAAHDFLICNGTATTPAWTVFAGGGGAAATSTMLAAPTSLNYASGCGGGSCLLVDDHWVTPTLDTTKWWAGNHENSQYLFGIRNDAGNFSYCGGDPNPNAPFSSFTMADTDPSSIGDIDNFGFTYPYGATTDVTAGFYTFGVFPYMIKDTDGTMKLSAVGNTYWSGRQCAGGSVTANITAGAPSITFKQAIPHTGGIFQYGFKSDTGLNFGTYPGWQCGPNDGGVHDATGTYNVSAEWGWNWEFTAMTSYEMGAGNSANPINNGNLAAVPNGGNWSTFHTVAIEYLGDASPSSAGTWNFYIDNIRVGTVATPSNSGGVDYNCSIQMAMAPTGKPLHGDPDFVNHPPPFSMWINDAQVWKKPGT